MTKNGNRPAGGPGSRSVVKPNVYFGGQPSTRVSPKGVSQIGQSIGDHATDTGRILKGGVEPVRAGAMPGVMLGNECAAITVCAVGGSRTNYGKSGTNAQHGPADPGSPPPAGELFPGFGKSGGLR